MERLSNLQVATQQVSGRTDLNPGILNSYLCACMCACSVASVVSNSM